jgi:hypothetical protein
MDISGKEMKLGNPKCAGLRYLSTSLQWFCTWQRRGKASTSKCKESQRTMVSFKSTTSRDYPLGNSNLNSMIILCMGKRKNSSSEQMGIR